MNLKKIKDNVILDTLITGKCKVGNMNDEVNMFNRCCPNYDQQQVEQYLQQLHAQFPTDTELTYELSTAVRPEVKYSIPIGQMALLFY